MAPNYNQIDSKLINDLRHLSEKKSGRRKLVKASSYAVPVEPSIEVESWKMDEFKYYDIPSPFPTLARGLFTTKIDGEMESGEPRYRIVVRGYDKFFNIGEVPWTTWDAIKNETKAPYTLTLKSNGCIIFVSAISADKLLVCSKHSLGPINDVPESHAQAGERWLEYHLKSVGKSKEDLAQTLWERNWTAVAELCDDEFEEHVLPYSRDKSGLHLHGLNESTALFKTQPSSVVDAFAREWGFIVTASTELSSVDEVKSFTDEVARTGKWNGEAVEGFVVRTTVTELPVGHDGDKKHSPYSPDSSFFFKVKFDEPYMMYRDWREVTKVLLSATGPLDSTNLPKSKMKRPETKLYVKWIIQEIKRDRKQFDLFAKGRGIIRTRERFLEWSKSREGEDALRATTDMEKKQLSEEKFRKTVIVPVAIPGVGKTALAVALAHLFGFAHTQSDDVKAKKAAPHFIRNVVGLLKDNDVVIADKNNHLRQHREQLRAAVQSFCPPVRLLALAWSLSDRPQATTHRICADRVLARGTNHQSLHGDVAARTHEAVIWQFLADAQELGDKEVDDIIEMDVAEDLEHSLDRAIAGVVQALGLPKPSREQVGQALAAIRGYTPQSAGAKTPKVESPRYFGLLPELDVRTVLGPILESHSTPRNVKEFWTALQEADRVTKRPHITLVHSKSKDDPVEADLWARCTSLHTLAHPPMLYFKLGRALCDGRVLALTAESLTVDEKVVSADGDPTDSDDQAGQEFIAMLPAHVRDRLHITVGTRSADIPPVEAKELIERWNKHQRDEIDEIILPEVWVSGRVKGLVS